ncbi:TPA: hypothetical protein ACIFC8_003414 [Acinetobacter baumannii]|nr:hypothetical protein [Acinetobacter baumannii]
MQQLMIMVTEVGKLEHTCNLLAEINKKGEVIKIYGHNGNELKINFLNNEVYFNKTWWQFTKQQNF